MIVVLLVVGATRIVPNVVHVIIGSAEPFARATRQVEGTILVGGATLGALFELHD